MPKVMWINYCFPYTPYVEVIWLQINHNFTLYVHTFLHRQHVLQCYCTQVMEFTSTEPSRNPLHFLLPLITQCVIENERLQLVSHNTFLHLVLLTTLWFFWFFTFVCVLLTKCLHHHDIKKPWVWERHYLNKTYYYYYYSSSIVRRCYSSSCWYFRRPQFALFQSSIVEHLQITFISCRLFGRHTSHSIIWYGVVGIRTFFTSTRKWVRYRTDTRYRHRYQCIPTQD